MRCERAGVFLGQVLEAEDTLVQCILASLLPGDSGITPPKESIFVQLDDGTVRLEVQVGGDKFILGDQIVGPQRDHLIGRAAAVHLARRITDTTWKYCLKRHGRTLSVLTKVRCLKGSRGLPELYVNWDGMLRRLKGIDLDAGHIRRDYNFLDISSKSPLKTMTASGDHKIATAEPSRPMACFNSHQYRQTVAEFIKDSFDTFCFHDSIDRLYAWLGLYKAVNAIAENGSVHRDLSWNNVRLFRPQQDFPLSVTIIDFDLASIIEGSSSGPPDETGTVAFMPIEVLFTPRDRAFRLQELREDESVFWIGFLAIIYCSKSGRKVVNSIAHKSSLEEVGNNILGMLTRPRQILHWPSWFAPQEDTNTIIRDLCLQLIEFQFTDNSNAIYLDVADKDENGVRRHKTRYERVFQKNVEEFEKRIGQLKKLQGIGGGQVERLTEGTQSLQI